MKIVFVCVLCLILNAVVSVLPSKQHQKTLAPCVYAAGQNTECAALCDTECQDFLGVMQCVKAAGEADNKAKLACALNVCPKRSSARRCVHGHLCRCANCMKDPVCPKEGNCAVAFEGVHPC